MWVRFAVSENPTTCPRLLMALACPLLPPSCRESAHMAVSPKKRNARKECAEAANVFAVRIGNSCFRHTDGFAAVVDPAPVDPTVACRGFQACPGRCSVR